MVTGGVVATTVIEVVGPEAEGRGDTESPGRYILALGAVVG